MQCPLCGGPLHVEDQARFACERGHDLGPDEMRIAASQRVTAALWMAIEALETEALALRSLDTLGRGDGDGRSLADQAEADARILRELASSHVPPSAAERTADE
jgi:hypothetical protein